MRDYLTLSWARFYKAVQSHTLQISKMLAHPAPRAGDLTKLDGSPKSGGGDANLEVIARFPGDLHFGRGLVDINFTMWPLFKCLSIDNILTIGEAGCNLLESRASCITTSVVRTIVLAPWPPYLTSPTPGDQQAIRPRFASGPGWMGGCRM
jgi:hypothetical protein